MKNLQFNDHFNYLGCITLKTIFHNLKCINNCGTENTKYLFLSSQNIVVYVNKCFPQSFKRVTIEKTNLPSIFSSLWCAAFELLFSKYFLLLYIVRVKRIVYEKNNLRWYIKEGTSRFIHLTKYLALLLIEAHSRRWSCTRKHRIETFDKVLQQ